MDAPTNDNPFIRDGESAEADGSWLPDRSSPRIRAVGRALGPFAPTALRYLVLIAVALLLILVLLPTALVAAGPG